MHAAHFHLPRAAAVSLIAGVLAILITLAITTSVNDVSRSSPQGAASAPVVRLAPTPPPEMHSTAGPTGSTPAWAGNPFSPLLGAPLTAFLGVRSGE